jgi:hypothetical protein
MIHSIAGGIDMIDTTSTCDADERKENILSHLQQHRISIAY